MASIIEDTIRSAVTKGVTVLGAINRRRLPAPDRTRSYAAGIHAPMAEELTIEDLPVTGTIPAALDGRYLRIGPNPIDPQPGYHWFTGDGMLHGLEISGGRALWYRNRWVRSTAVSTALGEAPIPGPRRQSDTVNTNIIGHAGKTLALVEAGSTPVEIGDLLESLAFTDFDGTLAGSFSAHPHRDPKTGELHAICYQGGRTDTVFHTVVGIDGKVRREEPVAVRDGPSIHDSAITDRYVLVLDLPVTFSMASMIAGHSFPYRWNADHQARVGLLPREGRGGEVIWCDVDPAYVFHVANAFDMPDGRVIVDVVAHDTMFAKSMEGPDSRHSAFERWTIDPEARTVDRVILDDNPQEFPRTDERRFGQPYRYAYAMALGDAKAGDFLGTHLIKHDLETGTRRIHDFGAGRHPGEFVFVPAYADGAEDEGWLMGLVIDGSAQTTSLVILDARNFEGEPVATIRLPHRIPPGFHGNWLPASQAA
jgi:carotenoid cleavage dioxygenase